MIRIALFALLLLITGCAAEPEEVASAEEMEAAVAEQVGPDANEKRVLPGDVATLQIVPSAAGPVVADREQYTLYFNEQDGTNPPKSTCVTPECTLVWVPLLAAGGKVEATGVDRSLVSTVERPDGLEQVTLAGRPLYRYVDDEQVGDVVGNGAEGKWFAIGPDGGKARR